jgi:hypothetical protein
MSNPQGTSDEDGVGADGITFLIATSATALGSAGLGIGCAGLAPTVVIEFDRWHNGGGDGNSGNQIGLNLNA